MLLERFSSCLPCEALRMLITKATEIGYSKQNSGETKVSVKTTESRKNVPLDCQDNPDYNIKMYSLAQGIYKDLVIKCYTFLLPSDFFFKPLCN